MSKEKEARGGHWSKPHPECSLPEATLYLCWSTEGTVDETINSDVKELIGNSELDAEDAATNEAVKKLLEASIATSSSSVGDVMAQAEAAVERRLAEQSEKEKSELAEVAAVPQVVLRRSLSYPAHPNI